MKKWFLFFWIIFPCSYWLSVFSQPLHIKHILDRLENQRQVLDDYPDTAYTILSEQIAISEGADRAVWHVCMAKFLYQYINENRYRLAQRTPVSSEESLPDFKTMDMLLLSRLILYHHHKSLENKEMLLNIEIARYKEILDTLCSEEYRPTLYHWLSYLALDFYGNGVETLPLPAKPFQIDRPDYFANSKTFSAIVLPDADTLSGEYLTLRQLQILETVGETGSLSRLDATLYRLSFVHSRSGLPNRDSLYLQTLLALSATYGQRQGYEDILFALGKFYHDRGNSFDEKQHPEYRSDYQLALAYYRELISFAPESLSAKNAQRLVENLTNKELTFSIPHRDIIPKQPSLITYHYRNIDTIYSRIMLIPKSMRNDSNLNTFNYQYYGYDLEYYLDKNPKIREELLGQVPFYEKTLPVAKTGDYRQQEGRDFLSALPAGRYLLLVSSQPFLTKNETTLPAQCTIVDIAVSAMSISYRKNSHLYEFFANNRQTGKPINGAKIECVLKSLNSQKTYKTLSLNSDKMGKAILDMRKWTEDIQGERNMMIEVWIVDGKNRIFRDNIRYWKEESFERDPSSRTILFTDRSIYRPGQMVYYKGIVVKKKGEQSLLVNERIKLTVADANGMVFKEVDALTNEYGSFSGFFEIPVGKATGSFFIRTDKGGYASFNVEEYKRPQFEVTLPSPDSTFRLNEHVVVRGSATAYAGYAIDGATVKYRVSRVAFSPCRYLFPEYMSEQAVANGNTTTDEKGNFLIDFEAIEDVRNKKLSLFYHFMIRAEVTDKNGETRVGTTSLVIGNQSLFIQLDMPDEIDMNTSNGQFAIATLNRAQKPVPAQWNYKIIALKTPDHYRHTIDKQFSTIVSLSDKTSLEKALPFLDLNNENDKSLWKELSVMASGTRFSPKDSIFVLPQFKQMSPGYYKILITAKSNDNQKDTLEKIVFLFDHNDKKSTVYQPIFIKIEPAIVARGNMLNVTVGSFLKEAHVLWEASFNGKLLFSKYILLHQEQKTIAYPVPEGQGLLQFHASVMQDNFYYDAGEEKTIHILNKKLDIEMVSFRDKTLTGARENWTLKIKATDSTNTSAELLCSMYDASLDAIKPHAWEKTLYLPSPFSLYNFDIYYNNRSYENHYRFFCPVYNATERQYPKLACSFGKIRRTLGTVRLNGDAIQKNEHVVIDCAFDMEASTSCMQVEAPAPNMKSGVAQIIPTTSMAKEPYLSPRTNFNETAFFFPALNTDSSGCVSLSFTMPDALTRWKFMAFAHRKDLFSGYIERDVYARKPLMVVPNLPRFLRENDTLTLVAKIVNTGITSLNGQAFLQLTDARTGKILEGMFEKKSLPFTVKTGKSEEVKGTVTVPRGVSAINCRWTVTANSRISENQDMPVTFSDGEEHLLPVLSNRMLVTESMPLPIHGPETKLFTFNKMLQKNSSSLQNYAYFVEFTANPLWYAIQALPSLMTCPYECNEQLFSKYYALALATHAIEKIPQLRQIFERWQKLSPDALLSNLEKNEELKNITLEESPWAMEARAESSKKQQLGRWFNPSILEMETESVLDRLGQGQNNDGGWSWFKGGLSNTFITAYILAGIGHLQMLETKNWEQKLDLKTAIQFMDKAYGKIYEDLKKDTSIHLKNRQPDSHWIHYLYARSFHLSSYPFDDKKTQEMHDFAQRQFREHWKNQSVYLQAMLALTFWREGDARTAKDILQHVKNKSQYSEEMGMYWKKENTNYRWRESPIERQSLLAEAFSLIGNDSVSTERILQWLLKQKQTQNWETTMSTVLACHALLTLGTPRLEEDTSTLITIGAEKISFARLPDAEAGSGYVKKGWYASDTVVASSRVPASQAWTSRAKITVKKNTPGTAWGAAYWQYFENMDKITASSSVFSITRKLYSVKNNDRGEVLVPVGTDSPLRVGDKVRVRVEIRVDRDLDFVHLKDTRAGAFEPENRLSGYRRQGDLWYYESTRDASTHIFFDHLPKGTHVLEYTLTTALAGIFSTGTSEIQCMYAPEMIARATGEKIRVE